MTIEGPWDVVCCSKCAYSKYNMDYIDTYPSIHICHNEQAENYNKKVAWCSVCELFKKGDSMDSFRVCTACERIFCFVDSAQSLCSVCTGTLREITQEEYEAVLSVVDGKVPGSCGCSKGGCSC